MTVRVALLSMAHVHAPSYATCLAGTEGAELAVIWDDDAARGRAAAQAYGCSFEPDLGKALDSCDAVVIASENLRHGELIEQAAIRGKAILCEKPVAASEAERARIQTVVERTGVKFATAFPCPFSPNFARLKARLDAGEIGELIAAQTTNRGTFPGGWFAEAEHSGGGAAIDHVVHVADLLRRLIGANPERVIAKGNNHMVGGAVEDCAMVVLEYPGKVFASLDASWSRPASYKTWGDVTLTLTGTAGVLEANLFGQALDLYENSSKHTWAGYGSNLDAAMVRNFIAYVNGTAEPLSSLSDGLAASSVALAASQSLRVAEPAQV